jgi:hypothetical protein
MEGDVEDVGDIAEVMSDIADTPTEPDVSLESCRDDEKLTFRCSSDGLSIQICLDAGWTHADQCDVGEGCFSSVLEPEPACVPRFNCHEATIKFISCDFAGLTPVDKAKCQSAYLEHAAGDDHEDVINCYDLAGCDETSDHDVYACIIEHCSEELTECYVDQAHTGDQDCIELFDCNEGCSAKCQTQCNVSPDPADPVEQASCLAECDNACGTECQQTGTLAGQRAYLGFFLCAVGSCADLSPKEQQLCFGDICQDQYLDCLATTAEGTDSCLATVACLSVCAGDEACHMSCAEAAGPQAIIPALKYVFCAVSAAEKDGACGGRDDETMPSCVQNACAAEHAACD